ncbi:V-type ATP synthase alpha chain [Oxobacter pfennigii]|uniref:V-type ATP synthase alpha chain n=1 Tax=Oxobacter pfennigii TaxID=36849 RepID=A0A0P8W592_9CLOT|nr:V-type ATP synthase subunit A [Oxobacter pfennigii]KPU43787.1 V-type ATP synthase alpha chain [Oxobacter pfennigii]
MENATGIIIYINGPVVKAKNMTAFRMREMVLVGKNKLIGEVISLNGDKGTIQVYEETEGLEIDEEVQSTGKALSLKLGPGIIGNIFDGIERPLIKINEMSKSFIPQGIGMISIDADKSWHINISVKAGDIVFGGQIYGTVKETPVVEHRLMVPPGIKGRVIEAVSSGAYSIENVLVKVEDEKKDIVELKMYHEWPVRTPRPVKERMEMLRPLITGQRVMDTFFPVAKGGTAAIPGGFGTGKTSAQHQLAKWSDADIIVYVGCGERGNEMTEVLEEFPEIADPKTGRPIMDRTVLIANTSNMPVAAREASIYTGITIAEYYRDMGYHVAMMADSTSRWAEALREISGRLEEMPAEEGFPAYLPSRLAEFYERAGYVNNLNGSEGSITIIGAVSPPGGEFSEPVTENTRRYVGVFWGLDKELAYSRHYPAVNWLTSHSGYLSDLSEWYESNVAPDMMELRLKMLKILYEENRLLEIVKLVGEDVLPDDQRLVLEISKIIRVGFLQQSAFHKEDTYVPLKKQYLMLKAINVLYDRSSAAVKRGAPISKIKNDKIYQDIVKMKYNIPNDKLDMFDEIIKSINDYYDSLDKQYA